MVDPLKLKCPPVVEVFVLVIGIVSRECLVE